MSKSKIFLILSPLLIISLFFLAIGGPAGRVSQNNLFEGLDGWIKAGSKPDSYEIGRDSSVNYDGKAPLYLKSISNVEDGFGTIMKYIKAKDYIGKRLKLSGYIKSEKIDGWAGMWFRVDAVIPGKMLGFDNMMNRPITGTNDWTKYEAVLDVPKQSAGIAYGVLIGLNGEVWFNDLSLEVVSDDVPTTNMLPPDTSNYDLTTTNYDELPDKLKNIPTGLEVKNTPNVVYATITVEKKDSIYYWYHETSVKAINEDLEITEFGAYGWVLNHWEFGTITGKPFTDKDFAEWYNCKHAKIKKGKKFTDKHNWSRNMTLLQDKVLWYYIAKNGKGELFKGTAMVDYLPELKK